MTTKQEVDEYAALLQAAKLDSPAAAKLRNLVLKMVVKLADKGNEWAVRFLAERLLTTPNNK